MGSEFGDFVQILLSSGILSLFCFSAIALVFAIIAIAVSRRRRAEKARNAQAEAGLVDTSADMLPESMPQTAPRSKRPLPSDALLPDLNMLLDTSGLKKDTPEIAAPAPRSVETFSPASTPTVPFADQPVRRATTTSVTLTNGETVEVGEVLSVLRDVVDGDVYIQLGSAIYDGFADDLDARTRFMKLIAGTKHLTETPSGGAEDTATSKAGETLALVLTNGTPVEVVRGLTILRDIVDGSLIAQIGGSAYAGLADLPNVKTRFVRVMRDAAALAEKSGGKVADLNTIGSEPAARLSDLIQQPQQPPTNIANPAAVAASAPPPPITPDGRMPGDLPNYQALKEQPLFQKRRRGEKAAPVPELDIAGAIEAYLQHKMSHTPGYQGRDIHVLPNGTGGVRIEVEGVPFDAVDEVRDPEVRAFLLQTIQEWQDRN